MVVDVDEFAQKLVDANEAGLVRPPPEFLSCRGVKAIHVQVHGHREHTGHSTAGGR
jgi:hypothetical protein